MLRLHPIEIPVAASMIKLAERQQRRQDPLQSYLLYWIAFNNIYTVVADRHGHRPVLVRDDNGEVRTRPHGDLQIPRVNSVSEREQIREAFAQFDENLKNTLVGHDSVRFFAERTPKWGDHQISHDFKGQRLNGVLNVGYTVDENHPVWSPISIANYEQYQTGVKTSAMRDRLAEELLWILYTVRNNIIHGGKRADDANDLEVVSNALPLLKMIVGYFTMDERRRSLS